MCVSEEGGGLHNLTMNNLNVFFSLLVHSFMPPILKKVIGAYNCWFVCACVHAYVTFLSLL